MEPMGARFRASRNTAATGSESRSNTAYAQAELQIHSRSSLQTDGHTCQWRRKNRVVWHLSRACYAAMSSAADTVTA